MNIINNTHLRASAAVYASLTLLMIYFLMIRELYCRHHHHRLHADVTMEGGGGQAVRFEAHSQQDATSPCDVSAVTRVSVPVAARRCGFNLHTFCDEHTDERLNALQWLVMQMSYGCFCCCC